MPAWMKAVLLVAIVAACSDTEQKAACNDFSASALPCGSEDGEWLLHGLSGGEQRHSPLSQITSENVDKVGLAFEYQDIVVRGRTHRGLQATPLMDDGILYFTGPWSVVYAVDARTGEEKWIYDPEVDGARARVACCDVVNRGVALKGDRLFVATTDGYLIALDKASGTEIWKVDTFIDRASSHTITGAPRLAGDVVVIGNGGAEMGVRGYVSAFDLKTGRLAWRFFTIPGAGPDETIDISRARETWSDETLWEYGGGGTAWDSMVYDAELDILYVGVGNGGPWPAWERGNGRVRDNLYLSSIVALDAKTGLIRWYYQTTPGDSWDYTATQHLVLADLNWDGAPRKVVMQAPKNGFFYVLDRENGELLAADPYVPVTWASGVNLKTGRPILNASSDYTKEGKVITPSPGGGHNWPPMAFNPTAGLVFIPTMELSSKVSVVKDGQGYLKKSRNNLASSVVQFPSASSKQSHKLHGQVVAWDPIARKAKWKSATQPVWTGGILSTDGNLVISGSADGRLNFFAADSGKLLRSIEAGTMITAPPIAYELDGTQYIAVLAGAGGLVIRGYLPTHAPAKYQNYGRLLVFKLDGQPVALPPAVEPIEANAIPEGLPADPATLALGRAQYQRHCAHCHAARNALNGFPDLWNMSQETNEIFDEIVLEGAMAYAGMASFDDVLTPRDTLAIRAYIADDRQKMTNERGEPQEMSIH